MTLRILFAIHAPCDPRTAVFRNVSSRATELRARGHIVDIIGPDAIGAPRFGGLAPLLFGLLLLRYGRLSSYDVVVFHSHAGWAFHALRRAVDRRRRVCTITFFDGLEPLYHETEERVLARHGQRYSTRFRVLHRVVLRSLLAFSCRRSNGVFCLNSTERTWLLDHRWCRCEDLSQLANGVEREFFSPPRQEGRPVRLIFVAQWLPRKGIRDLVKAFVSLASGNPDLELVCAGTFQPVEVVRSQFPDDVRHRVAVFPSVDRAEMLALLRSADIFVFPTWFEGFSGALLEGMAASLGVVATTAGSGIDLLEDRRNALTVACEDPPALARAVQELIDDAPLRRRLGLAASERASKYCWDLVNVEYADHLLAVYDRSVGARRPRPTAQRILFGIHAPCDARTAVFRNVSSRAGYLRSLGHTVDIVGPEALGVRRFGGLAPLLIAPMLLRRGRLSTYDIVVFQSHAGWAFHALRLFVDRGHRVRAVTAFHGLEPLYHAAEERVLAQLDRHYSKRFQLLHRVLLQSLLAFSCRHSDAVFCLNSTERAWLLDHRWCRPENLFQLANGVEQEFLVAPRPDRPATRLAFSAQWLPRKGIHELVEAFTALAATNPELQLVCVGTGQSEEPVRAAFPPDVRARISVFPSVDRTQMLKVLQSSDIFLFPSSFEGFSSALLEAMAVGLAIVATPVGAVPDLLHDRDNALIVACMDAAALAGATREIIVDDSLRSRLGRRARETASRYSWDRVNAEYAARLLDTPIESLRSAPATAARDAH